MIEISMIKGINTGILVVTLVLLISVTVLGATNVYVSPVGMQKLQGNSFVINISINSSSSVYAVEGKLKFNPSILSVISAVEGNFLKKDSSSTYPIITINNSEGFVKIANTRFNTQTGVSGEGSILVITFNSSAAGNSALALEKLELVDPNLDKINSGQANGSVEILSGSNNNPPTNPTNVNLIPLVAYRGTTFLCNASGSTDVDNDVLTYYYEFRELGNVLKAYSTSSSYTCSGSCNKNDNITCYAKTYDSKLFSGEKASNSVIILNSAPSQPIVEILPELAKKDSNLTCNIKTPSTDINGDSITYSYSWYKNNVLQPGLTGNIVDKSLLSRLDLWVCNVTPNDGQVNGISGFASKVIIDSVPEARIILNTTTQNIQVLGIAGDGTITSSKLVNETYRYDYRGKYLGKLYTYLITDEYNNTLKIILFIPAKGGVQVWSLQYNSGIVTTPANYYLTWKIKYPDFSQTLQSGKTKVAKLSYKSKTNTTSITIGKSKSTRLGAHLIELYTNSSVVNYKIN